MKQKAGRKKGVLLTLWRTSPALPHETVSIPKASPFTGLTGIPAASIHFLKKI
jgi:hypothetical protein